jgi:hypothetical protein
VKTALGAPLASQEELLGLYNLATALDPALVALTCACPFYEGRAEGAARTVHYRGILGSFHFFSVGLAVSAAYLVGTHAPDALGWAAGAFAATATYLMVVGFENAAARL